MQFQELQRNLLVSSPRKVWGKFFQEKLSMGGGGGGAFLNKFIGGVGGGGKFKSCSLVSRWRHGKLF